MIQNDTLRGIVLMIAAMAGFAGSDAFIKQVSGSLPAGEVMFLLGLGGTIVFSIMCRARGLRVLDRALLTRPVMLRNLAEMVGSAGFVLSLSLIPISTASAVLQAAPLTITAGAALLLGERVGWRRWSAVAVGLCGVLLIVRPGMAGFDWNVLFAVAATLALSLRDLATRATPASVGTPQLSAWGFAAMALAGLVLLALFGGARMPAVADWGRLSLSLVLDGLGYLAVVSATRIGDLSVVAPFRYSRLLFALVIGAWVFGEHPDALMYAGAVLVIGSGIYTFWRERRR